MKTKWFALVMLAGLMLTGTAAFAESHWSIGVGIGAPYYAPPVVAYRPPYPGPGYYWIDGYYDPYGAWIPGYWAPPRAYGYGYVGPRYYAAPRYYGGYVGGFRRFDRDDFRRFDRDHDRGRGWGRR